MKTEKLTAYCSYLSPKDLVAHVNSLIPLVEQANKKQKRQCSSTNHDDDELSNTQLHKFAVGKRVFFVLDGLYTKSQVHRMNQHDGDVIVNTCVDGSVTKRTNSSVILDILGTSLSVLVRISDCPKYIHNRNINRKHYLSGSALTTMKESNNLQSDQKDRYEQIIQLIRESNRCTTNKSFIGLNQHHDSAKSIPCCQESRSKTSSKTVLVNRDSKAKNFPKFNRARVGDTVILQLGALYSSVEKQELVSTDRNLLLTSVRGSVVAKTSFAAEVCIDSSNLRVSLPPVNYQRGVGISEHHLNLNRDAERLKAALKLVRHSSFCVQHPTVHSASVSGVTTQSYNAVVNSSDMASDSSYSSDDNDSEEEEEEEEFNLGEGRSISDVKVPSIATYGADGQVILLSDRRCKYTSRGCAQGVAPTCENGTRKRKAGCADLQSPHRAVKLFSAPRHHPSTDVIDRGASQACRQRVQHQQSRPHGDLRGYVLSAAAGLRRGIPKEEVDVDDDKKSSNLCSVSKKEVISSDDDDDKEEDENDEDEEEEESFIDYDYKERRRRSAFAAAVRKDDRSNSSSDEDMPGLALLPKVTQYKQYNTTYWSGCK